MRKTTFVLAILALLIAPAAVAQTPEHPHQMAMEADHMDCAAMMAKQKDMTSKMDDMDARLQKMVEAMNAAKGAKKTDAMAAVISELVTQRKAMRDMAMNMQPMMAQHMAEHMHEAMAGAMKSMQDCPMMKGAAEKTKP